jgi:hypothetical protein
MDKSKFVLVKLKKTLFKNKKHVTKKKYQGKQLILAKKRRNQALAILFGIMGSVAEKFIMFVEN